MNLRAKILLTVAGLLLLTGATCETGGGHKDFPDPDPGKAYSPKPKTAPTIKPDPAPDPSAMVSAEENPKFVTMELRARNIETGGEVKYTVHSGAEQTIALESYKAEDGVWWVVWSLPVVAESGKRYGFTWYPKGPGNYAQCLLYAQGVLQDYQHVQRGSCAASYQVPG